METRRKIRYCIIVASLGVLVVIPLALKHAAAFYNNRVLREQEEAYRQEFERHDVGIQDVKSGVHGESYFMLGDVRRDRWLESCIYFIRFGFDAESFPDPDRIAAVREAIHDQVDSQVEFHINNRVQVITITWRVSMPLGVHRTISDNDGTATLVPLARRYPLPFYDARCRTKMMLNGG